MEVRGAWEGEGEGRESNQGREERQGLTLGEKI